VRAEIVLLLAVVAVGAHELRDPHVHGVGDVVWAFGFVVLGWLFGLAVRGRHRRIHSLERETVRLEAAREQEARAAVAAERARVARELHDVVAHAVSVVVVQSQAAQRLVGVDDERTRQSLEAIEETARTALNEMRRLLGMLRETEDVARAPQPGLASLDALVAQVREAGLAVSVEVEGESVPLSPGAELSAYRIVQEGLTNVLKHAPGVPRVRADPVPRRRRRDRDRGRRRRRRDRRQRRGARAAGHARARRAVRGRARERPQARRRLAAAGEAAGRGMTDVLIVDDQELVHTGFRMPVLDGIEATRQIRADVEPDRGPRVLVLTTFDLDEHVYAALRAGASGFLLKDVRVAQLVEAVRTVAARDALIAPSVTKRLVAEFAARPTEPERPPELAELTPRELEVLELVARGLSNGEIARHPVVGEATVKTHVTRILTKLRLRGRVQAVVLAHEAGIVRPGAR
jgi:DNA-binding NarL/FixJ family response regulator